MAMFPVMLSCFLRIIADRASANIGCVPVSGWTTIYITVESAL